MVNNTKKADQLDILGVNLSVINMDDARRVIVDLIRENKQGYVSVCPVSTIMACQKNERLRKIVNSANLVTPDGMPSVWIGKARGFKNIERVYGPDLMLSLCQISSQKGYRNYFYGATDEVLNALRDTLQERFPGLHICGQYAPPYRELTEEEDKKIIQHINNAAPDILWIGLGSPKQDIWIDEHRQELNVGVSLAVGAAFDFLSGTKPQAPRWMQKSGLEWFFRLCCEPRRLWRRYFVGNTMFIYLMIKDVFKKKMVHQ